MSFETSFPSTFITIIHHEPSEIVILLDRLYAPEECLMIFTDKKNTRRYNEGGRDEGSKKKFELFFDPVLLITLCPTQFPGIMAEILLIGTDFEMIVTE